MLTHFGNYGVPDAYLRATEGSAIRQNFGGAIGVDNTLSDASSTKSAIMPQPIFYQLILLAVAG